MRLPEKVRAEIRSVGLTALFFAVWILGLLFLKWLVLSDYNIEFDSFSIAFIGALIIAKVVLVLEHVPLGALTRDRSALVHVIVRTCLYGFGVLVVLILEKAFEARHDYGGFGAALVQIIGNPDIPHVLAAAIGVTCALLIFNLFFVFRRQLGKRELYRIFLSPLQDEKKEEG